MTERHTCRLLPVRCHGPAFVPVAANAQRDGGSGSHGHTVQLCDTAGCSKGSSPTSPRQDSVTTAAFEMHAEAVHNLALQVQDGDMIDIDVGKKAMTLEIPEQVHTADCLWHGRGCRGCRMR